MVKPHVLKRIWIYVGKYKVLLIGVFICAVLGNVLALLAPLLIGKAIDGMAGVGKVDFKVLSSLSIILVLLYVFGNMFQWFMAVASNRVANKTIQDIRKDAFYKMSTLPINYFDNRSQGDIISRLTNDIDAISEGLFQGITQVISALVIVVGTFVFMMSISVTITVIVVLITPICFLIASFIAKKSQHMFREQSKTLGELNGYVEEIIGNQKVVKAFAYETHAEEKFDEINSRLYHWGQQSQWYSSLTNPTTRFVNNLAYVAVVVLGGIMAIWGTLSVGQIASFITYSNQFAKPINEIASITTQIQTALASAKRVFELLDEKPEPYSVDGYMAEGKVENVDGNIEFSHVDFSYKAKEPLITDLNLRANPGEMVAIVGPTGAGKTTLVNLLMRFYDVDEGAILLDGENIKKFQRESYRRTFGMVLQETWLFKGSIAENISYGKSDAAMEEIIAASKEAHAHQFIKRLENGYDTIIEEDGRNLSGGQKQLLTIARVLLLNPPILILDEATSSIDTRTEVYIQRAFHKMMQGRTSFVIAHRLSTIQEADTILVMNYGQIVEQGNHKELLAKKGFYHKLYQSQFEE